MFAFKAKGKGKKSKDEGEESKESSVSVGVRGPVSIHTAVSLEPVTVTGVQITKSVNNEPGDKKGSNLLRGRRAAWS